MSVRHVFLASVSAAFLAASAAVSGPAAAATTSPNALLAQNAYRALTGGDNAGAIAAYSKAIESRELEPEVLANALLNRALAYQRLEQHEDAINDYTAALRLDAMSGKLRAMALYNRGLSQQKLSRPSQAVEDYTSALFLDSEFAYAYYSRANLLRDSGQYLFALSDYEKAIRYRHPDPARVYYNEAVAFEALKRPDNARQSLAKALTANPQFAPAQKKLAALTAAGQAPLLTASVAAAADRITTSSIAETGGTLVASKPQLPEAVAPGAELLGADGTSPSQSASGSVVVAARGQARKTITDRLPAAEPTVSALVETQTAAIDQAGVSATAEPEEKIVAVEAVPEEPASPSGAETAGEDVAAAEPDSNAAPAEETSAAPVQSGWSVQLASATSEDAAWSTWKKMRAKHRVLADKNPVVVKADLGTKGTFYRVRLTGYEDQGKAKDACSRLKSAGVKCFISKINS